MKDKRNYPSSVTAGAVPPSPQGEGLTAEERQKRVASAMPPPAWARNTRTMPLEVHIRVDKAAGEATGTCTTDGRSPVDDIYGAAVLLRHIAKKYRAAEEQVLAKLAVLLLTQEGPERADVGIGPYDERSGGDGQD